MRTALNTLHHTSRHSNIMDMFAILTFCGKNLSSSSFLFFSFLFFSFHIISFSAFLYFHALLTGKLSDIMHPCCCSVGCYVHLTVSKIDDGSVCSFSGFRALLDYFGWSVVKYGEQRVFGALFETNVHYHCFSIFPFLYIIILLQYACQLHN